MDKDTLKDIAEHLGVLAHWADEQAKRFHSNMQYSQEEADFKELMKSSQTLQMACEKEAKKLEAAEQPMPTDDELRARMRKAAGLGQQQR